MTSLTVLSDPFAERLARDGVIMTRAAITVLQLNVGKMCNQTCRQCHVDAGPHRREIMTLETVDRVLDWLALTGIQTVDITGGAPELTPHFEHLVAACRGQGRQVIEVGESLRNHGVPPARLVLSDCRS